MSDQDLRQISLGLYQYLCRHVVGTEDTVRARILWNTLKDNIKSKNSETVITSGSFGEGLEMKGSDIDNMYVLRNVVVFEEVTDIRSDHAKEAYFQIITDDTKPGFVKLFHIDSTNKLYIDLCEKVGSDLYLSNAVFKQFILYKRKLTGYLNSDKIHGPCISDNEGLFDQAYCLHCSSFISQADQWRLRSQNSWPSNYVKARIIEHGVLFVPIGVKDSPNENIQWRISFSLGEKLLIYSFTHTQLLCYALMKIVLKDLINTDPECEDLLCSYFIKNIMFWISEELPLSMWRPDNLLPCFMRCLERLIYCVEYSLCVHYFIPENNMFENRIEGAKRHILLDKLRTLYSFKWQCILLSPQLKTFHVDHLNFEAHLFDIHFEQILCSKVLLEYFDPNTSVSRTIRMILTYGSPLIKHSTIHILSQVCNGKAQYVHLRSTYGNKKLYRQYKLCQCYLMQALYHDAPSGWLLVSSMFYRMKQYKRACDILFYALEKISPEKVMTGAKLSSVQCDLLKSETITAVGLVKAINILYVDKLFFDQNLCLIPNELGLEIINKFHTVSSVVYGHFLSFLCHFHLHDIRKCRDSIRDIILTISQRNFINDSNDEASAYNCLGVVFLLIGDIESARQALKFLNAIKHD